MSSGFGNFMKNGWHPEKEGTTLKGQVNGLLGRNKDRNDRSDHVARPLSSLQDPSSFAPPPRRAPGQPLPPPSRSSATSPGPPPPYEDSNRYAQQNEHPEEDAPPPQPFRVNTTGLSTSHLPPPPGRKDGADGRSPSPGQTAARPPPPSLPPRLPPRTPSSSSTVTAPPGAPAASGGGGYLNQSAINRLGAAGVSVPSLGIGRTAPEPPARSNASSPAPPPRMGAFSPPSGQMNELQNRFAKLGKSSGQSPSPPPAEGTTMEQKQSALRTASKFHKDPSSVSMADARSAASTFNNFRQRHGEQVAAGVKSANNLNQKYGIADKVGKYAGQAAQAGQQQTDASSTTPGPLSPPAGLVNALGKKKPPPPPPPKKKPQLQPPPPPPPSGQGHGDEPPPIPLATKPTF